MTVASWLIQTELQLERDRDKTGLIKVFTLQLKLYLYPYFGIRLVPAPFPVPVPFKLCLIKPYYCLIMRIFRYIFIFMFSLMLVILMHRCSIRKYVTRPDLQRDLQPDFLALLSIMILMGRNLPLLTGYSF